MFLLQGIWNQLHLDGAFRTGLQLTKRDVSKIISLIHLMVFHGVCTPGSKLSCLRWLETADVSNVPGWATHLHLLRAMDALIRNLDNIEHALANLLHPLLDRELTLAIYDLTTVRIHGEAEVLDLQFVLGVPAKKNLMTKKLLPKLEFKEDGCR